MPDIKDALQAEVAALRADIRANPDPRQLKLDRAEELLALYTGQEAAPTRAPFVPPKTAAVTVKRTRRGDAHRARAMEIAEAVLKGRTEPYKTSDILSAIEAEGIAIGGNSPVSNLSAMLSRSPVFIAHGRTGWTLAEMFHASLVDVAEDVERQREGYTFTA